MVENSHSANSFIFYGKDGREAVIAEDSYATADEGRPCVADRAGRFDARPPAARSRVGLTGLDTEGFVLKAKVHRTKVVDYGGIKTLLWRADRQFPRLSHLWLDAGYRGEDKGADWCRRPWGGAWISSSARERPPQKRC